MNICTAAKEGDTNTVNTYIKDGGDVNAMLWDGSTPLITHLTQSRI